MGKDSQGRRANDAGEALRREVHDLLKGLGTLCGFKTSNLAWEQFDFLWRRDLAGARLSPLMRGYAGVFARDPLVGRTIYRRPLRTDFVLQRFDWADPVVVWCQHQDESGSADQKLPYVLDNLRSLPYRSLLVLTGSRLADDEGVMGYVRERVAGMGGRIAHVFDGSDGLRTWIVRGMLLADPEPALAFDC